MQAPLVVLLFAAGLLHGSSQEAVPCYSHASCSDDEFCQSIYNICKHCSNCLYDSDSATGRCPSTRCPGTPAAMEVDSAPPDLRWLSVEPTFVSVLESSPVYVSIFLQVDDDISGYQWAQVKFTTGSQASQIQTFSVGETDLVNGTPNSGFYETVFWFEALDEGGLWQLSSIVLHDRASNSRE
eukprot:767213-Rhodomonas_salina.1